MKIKSGKKGVAAMFALVLPIVVPAAGIPRDDAARLNAEGVRLMQANDASGAIDKFKAAIDADKTCMEAYHNLGKLLIIAKEYAAAEQLLRNGLRTSPSDAGCLVQLAQATALSGKSEECRKVLRDDGLKKDKTLLPSLALLLMAQRSYPEAEYAIGLAVSLFPREAENWYDKGLIHERQEQWSQAEKAYSRAVELQPDYVNAIVNYGNMLDKQNRTDSAIASYEKAYALSPDSPLALYNLGRMLVLKGRDPVRGLSLLQKATKYGSDRSAVAARELLNYLVAQTKKGGVK